MSLAVGTNPAEEFRLSWADIEPALLLVDTLEELQQAFQFPEAFLKELAKGTGAAARRFAVARLRQKLEPHLRPLNLSWPQHVEPALATIESIEQLQEAFSNPEGYIKGLLRDSAGPAAAQIAIAAARPHFEPLLPNNLM